MVTLEGAEETLRIVLIEFPSMEHAKAFYASPEYARAKKMRDGAGAAKFVAIEGYSMEAWEYAANESASLSLA